MSDSGDECGADGEVVQLLSQMVRTEGVTEQQRRRRRRQPARGRSGGGGGAGEPAAAAAAAGQVGSAAGQASQASQVSQAVKILERNRALQRLLREQVAAVEEAQKVNERAKTERTKDWVTCKRAQDRMLRKRDEQKRHCRAQRRLKKDDPGADSSTQQWARGCPLGRDELGAQRSATRSNVPLTYPTPKLWTKAETDNLQQHVRQHCQEIKVNAFLDQQQGRSLDEFNVKSRQLERMDLIELTAGVQITWEEICKRFSSPRRTAADCRVHWLGVANPQISADLTWSSEERTQLGETANKYKFDGSKVYHWSKIAETLGTNRTAIGCFREYQQHLNDGLLKTKWEPAEDARLLELFKKSGARWQCISQKLPGRTGTQCLQRYEYALIPTKKKGRWEAEEDIRLEQAALGYTSESTSKLPWNKIARHVEGRSAPQCRERWMNVLKPEVRNLGDWTAGEDGQLASQVERFGVGNWSQVSQAMAPRTDNQCWRRWKRLHPTSPAAGDLLGNKKQRTKT